MPRSPNDNPNTEHQNNPRLKHPSGKILFASAISDADDPVAATDQVLSAITQKLKGPIDLMMVFVTVHHQNELKSIHRRLSGALSPEVSLAVTAGGVIGSRRELEHSPGLSVLAGRLPGATLRPFGHGQTDWQAITDSPGTLDEEINPDADQLKAIIMLADPFTTPMANLLPMMNRRWPGVPTVGGMASAGTRPGENALLVNGQVQHEGAVGVAISGDIRVDCTISQGCRAIGKPYVITKSQRHIVYELGGHNALEVIQETIQNLSESDRELVESRGLMIGRVIDEYKERFGRGDFLIRHLLAVDQETGYVAINDPQIHVGQTVQFHVHDQQTATEDFKLLLEGQKLHGSAAGAMLFSCNGRGTNLFDEPHTDASLIHESLDGIPLAGFFASGEIGPVGNENFLHGHTASLIVFRGTN